MGCTGQTTGEPESLGQSLGAEHFLNLLSVSFSTFALPFLDRLGLTFTHLDMGRHLGNKGAVA